MQACSIVLSKYGTRIAVTLALPVLQLLHGLSATDAPGVSVSVSAAQLVHRQHTFLSHGVRSEEASSTGDTTVLPSPGTVSLLRLIRHPNPELQHAALRCYAAVTINDSENTYRFAEVRLSSYV